MKCLTCLAPADGGASKPPSEHPAGRSRSQPISIFNGSIEGKTGQILKMKRKKTLLLCFIHGFKVRASISSFGTSTQSDLVVMSLSCTCPTPSLLAGQKFKANTHCLQGDGDTFGTFPEYLRVMTSHALPSNLDVVVEVYPKFETRGDLKECVGRLRDWWVRGSPSPELLSLALFVRLWGIAPLTDGKMNAGS